MTQVSGSITVDMTKLVRVIQEEAARINTKLDQIGGDHQHRLTALNTQSTIATLSHHLPSGVSHPHVGSGRDIAAFLAHRLAEAGYALVPVSGEAVEAATVTDSFQAASDRADARLAQAARDGVEDSWYEPDN